MSKTTKAKNTEEVEGEVQSSPETSKVQMATLSVNTRSFRGIKRNTTIDVVLDDEVEGFIRLGLIIPMRVFEVEESEVNESMTLNYQTRCKGCGDK